MPDNRLYWGMEMIQEEIDFCVRHLEMLRKAEIAGVHPRDNLYQRYLQNTIKVLSRALDCLNEGDTTTLSFVLSRYK